MMRSRPYYESWEINCRKQALVIFPVLPEPSDGAARSTAKDKRAWWRIQEHCRKQESMLEHQECCQRQESMLEKPAVLRKSR